MIIFLLVHFTARGQFPYPKNDKIRLLTDTNATNVIYDLNDVRFYFKQKTLLKYLENRLKENVYKKLAERGDVDSNYTILLDTLKMRFKSPLYIKGNNLVFNSKTGELNKTVLQNYYQRALNELIPYIMIDGKLAVFDHKRNALVKSMKIKQEQTFDFLGWRQILTLFYPDGKLLYTIQNRRSPDGNDL